MTTPPKAAPPANPTVFTMTVPNAEVAEVLTELKADDRFDATTIKQTQNNDGTTTITIQRKAGQ
jgi:hypothetical protein